MIMCKATHMTLEMKDLSFQEPDQKEIDVRNSACGKSETVSMKHREFLVRGGEMDGAIYQGTAAIHPTCLNACARRTRRKEDLSIP